MPKGSRKKHVGDETLAYPLSAGAKKTSTASSSEMS
jgi:hypothetical protein